MKTGFFHRRRPAISPESLELRAEIDRTRHTIESASSQFEQVVDPTLIDCYIYELKAEPTKGCLSFGRHIMWVRIFLMLLMDFVR